MKTVFLTGANRGIGLELTKTLSEKGYKIIAGVRNSSSELEKISNVKIMTGLELEDISNVKHFLKNNEFPKLDWIILNAGIFLETPLDQIDIELVEKQIRVNTLSPLVLVSGLLNNLQEGSKIALITSLMGSIHDNTSGGYYGYRMSKAALNMMGKSLSVDLKNRGIITCLLHPGYVKTRMTDYMGNVDPEVSARSMIKVIEDARPTSSGTFYHYRGTTLPW